jgi:hypothetical protein
MLPIYPLSWRAPEGRRGEESLAKPLIARLGATRGDGPPPRDDKNEFSSCASKARIRAARQGEPLGVPERLTLHRATGVAASGGPASLRVGPIAPSRLGGRAYDMRRPHRPSAKPWPTRRRQFAVIKELFWPMDPCVQKDAEVPWAGCWA